MALVGDAHQFFRLRQFNGEHFFRVDVFAAFQQLLDDGEVGLGVGKVDDEFNAFVRQDFLHGHGLDFIFFRGGIAAGDVQIATTGQFDDGKAVLEVFQVNIADCAATNYGRSNSFHRNPSLILR